MLDYRDAEEREKRRGNLIGAGATVLYIGLWVALLLLVHFTLDQKETEGEGIMINFGNVDEAAPGMDMAMNDQIADAQQQEQQPRNTQVQEEEQLTQDFEEAPAVQPKPQKKKPTPKPKVESTPTPKTTPQPPAEKPREVNRRALFPGRTPGSTSSSEGTGTGAGNQGDLAGDPNGSHDGTGTGTSGGSASLAGRSLLGSLPRPDYGARESGKVVVEITVNQQGRVTAASFRSVGSTTQNSALVDAALRAARQARFNVDEGAALSQRGTITYIFRMQ